MRQALHPRRILLRPPRARRAGRTSHFALLPAAALLLVYLASPYVALWRLNQAVRADDPAALAVLVDLEAMRHEITRKLNKDAQSTLGTLSDGFIGWLEGGIQSLGSDAVDRLVTLDWVRQRLLAHTPGSARDGFLGEIDHAFFDAPASFRLHIGPPGAGQVQARLALRGFGWRISALWY